MTPDPLQELVVNAEQCVSAGCTGKGIQPINPA